MYPNANSHFETNYQTRLSDWNTRASVRVRPMHKFYVDEGALPFAPELVPVLTHQTFTDREPGFARIVMAQRLFTYLRFTEYLELLAVIPASTKLWSGDVPFHVPYALRRDANKIVTDEGHHAECAADLEDQIVAATGEKPHRAQRPQFLQKLRSVEHQFWGCSRNLATLTFTAVSETLITGTLTKIPADTRVHPVIRAVITDHARDEARHHACYSEVIRIMWDQLGSRQRDEIGPLFGEFIESFLAPDLVAELNWLEAAGFEAREAKRIIEETYEALDLASQYKEAARPTLNLMERFGMLGHLATLDGLAAHGLI